MMAEENKDPLQNQEPTPVVFSKETIEEFARAVAAAIDAAERSSNFGARPDFIQQQSGARSGSSTIEQEQNPLSGPSRESIAEGLSSSTLGERSFDFLDNFGPSKTASRASQFRDDQSSVDGILPTYFGGKVGWQQINKLGIESIMKGGIASKVPGLSSALPYMLYADENAVGIQAGIDKAQSIYRTGKAFDKSVSSFGSQLGASPGDGTFSSIGPIRPPFINPAAMTGITETVDSTVYGALNAGISGAEQRALKTQLSDVGFYSGQEDRDTMLKGLEELYKFDPAVADPELLASATRYGQTPVDNVVKSMKELKEVAKAANVGVEDFIAQVKAAGEAAKDSGGSMAKGVERAKMFSSATGLPASTGEAIQASPVVEGMMSGMFGATPYEMGAIAPGTQTLGSMEALQQVISTVGPMEPLMINGVEVLSGEDRRAAMISEMLGGTVETSQIKKLMNKDFAHNARETLEVENAVSLAKSKKGEGKEFVKAAGNITKEVVNAKNRKGQPLYTEKEIEDVKNAGGDVKDIGFNSVTGEFNIDAITDGGMFNNRLDDDGKKLRDWLYDQGYEKESKGQSDKDFIKKTLTPNLKKTYIATQKVEAGERAEAGRRSRTEKDRTSETKATIDFTPQAKKWLRQITPGGQNNNARDAGGRPSVQNQNGPSKFGQGG